MNPRTSAARQVQELQNRWAAEGGPHAPKRDYSAEDVVRLRGSIRVEHSIARHGAQRFRELIDGERPVRTFGAMTGAQAVQMVRADVPAIYVSGWQVAADANLAGHTYPDQSLYPSNSVPALVRRINNALLRADQVEWGEGKISRDWLVPIVADAEAGFGGPIHAYELMRQMIEAGVAAVHFEDQLAAEKKCGHMGGKVLVPTAQFIRSLNAARLAADVADVPTVIIARTDALSANLMTSDVDEQDAADLTGERTPEGYHRVRGGIEAAIRRSLAYAPYADLLWFETAKPDLGQAREYAQAIHQAYPDKPLAYNCSPSFNWARNLDQNAIASFQDDLAELGYRFQFITLAGWHLINLHTYELATNYVSEGMSAYVQLQQQEFAREADGYTAVRHQREAGAGYFDRILTTVSGGHADTAALAGSTESEQFDSESESAAIAAD